MALGGNIENQSRRFHKRNNLFAEDNEFDEEFTIGVLLPEEVKTPPTFRRWTSPDDGEVPVIRPML